MASQHNQPQLSESVWGEGSLEEIQMVDDTRVMLLWPPVLKSRKWGGGFFSPIIHSALPRIEVISELEQKEIERWFERLNLNSGKITKKRFWQFWK